MTTHPAARWQRWLNRGVIVLGLLTVLYALLWLGRGPVTCRGVEMHPGDVCVKSSFTDLSSSQTQTYEQRRRSASQSRPTLVGAGLVIAAFGAFLVRREGGPGVDADEERLLATH